MHRPADYIPAFEEALREVVQQQDPTFAKTTPLSQLKIGLQVLSTLVEILVLTAWPCTWCPDIPSWHHCPCCGRVQLF